MSKCGNYGCKNCKYHKVWYSNDYWSPDEHECIIPKDRLENPDFECSDEELDNIFDIVWVYGNEWDNSEKQICPYYTEYIPDIEDF